MPRHWVPDCGPGGESLVVLRVWGGGVVCGDEPTQSGVSGGELRAVPDLNQVAGDWTDTPPSVCAFWRRAGTLAGKCHCHRLNGAVPPCALNRFVSCLMWSVCQRKSYLVFI